MNYAELVAAVTTYTQNTYPTADMNTMIQQAEQRIYNTVQLANLRKNIKFVALLLYWYLTAFCVELVKLDTTVTQ